MASTASKTDVMSPSGILLLAPIVSDHAAGTLRLLLIYGRRKNGQRFIPL